MKRAPWALFGGAGTVSAALLLCLSVGAPADAAPVTLRFGHTLPTTHPWSTCGVETLQANIKANPALEIELQVFPGGQLGSNEELVASVAQGSLDLALPGVGSVSPFYEPFGVMEAFFAFKDLDHLYRVWHGEIGNELKKGAADAGLTVLGDLWYIGLRQVTANFPVRSPADLAGKTMRSQDTPASFANIRALGGNPTPIAYGELYLALSQGVVDSEENPTPNILSAKFYEVQKYLMVTNHVPQMGSLLINTARWQGLTDAQRTGLEAAANAAATKVRGCIEEQETATLAKWRSDPNFPMKVIDDVDRAAFEKNALERFTGPEGPSWRDLFARIQATP